MTGLGISAGKKSICGKHFEEDPRIGHPIFISTVLSDIQIANRTRTGGRHFDQPQIDGVGQNGGQQECFVFDRVSRFEMSEMTGEIRPFIDLQQQFRDFDMRQKRGGPVNQRLGGGRNGRVQRGHFKSGFGDEGVRQMVAQSQPVYDFQLLLQKGNPLLEISLRVRSHGQRDHARFFQFPEDRSGNEVVLEILELPGSFYLNFQIFLW